jgi:hypothetical protein
VTYARLFWLLLILMGSGTTAAGSHLHQRAETRAVKDRLQGEERSLLGFADSTALDMSGAGVTALGGLIALMGLIGMARTFREDKSDEEPGLPTSVDLPPPPEPKDEPSNDELLRRLVWPTMPGGDDTPPVQPKSSFPRSKPAPPSPGEPRESRTSTSSTRDPTTWQQPEGFLFLFDGRDSQPFHALVLDLSRRHLSGTQLLIAHLRGVAAPSRSVIAVLGEASAIERFDSIYRQFAGLEFGVRGLNPSRTRPQATLQARSYDPAWVVPNPEPYRAEREAIRKGAYSVRDVETI